MYVVQWRELIIGPFATREEAEAYVTYFEGLGYSMSINFVFKPNERHV